MPNQEVNLNDNSNCEDQCFWSSVNHIALIVSDVGRSLGFYVNILKMQQIIRPDFDRHGAWLTFGNVDLHLIKGKPLVHHDDDLIVGHIALTILEEEFEDIRSRLEEKGVSSRQNISVPNPNIGRHMSQAFVRDPDGYYIELCASKTLHDFIEEKTNDNAEVCSQSKPMPVVRMSSKMKMWSTGSKRYLEESHKTEYTGVPDWMKDNFMENFHSEGVKVDEDRLVNLIKRRKIYGDLCQCATENQLRNLMMKHNNHVKDVLSDIKTWVLQKGTQTLIPPAFYDRDGSLHQPPSFEMALDESPSWVRSSAEDV